MVLNRSPPQPDLIVRCGPARAGRCASCRGLRAPAPHAVRFSHQPVIPSQARAVVLPPEDVPDRSRGPLIRCPHGNVRK